MNKPLLAIAATIALLPLQALASIVPFVNEFHYDNAGSDTGEGIEIAGSAGTVLDGWTLLLYNGGTGTVYGSTDLSGTIADQSGGFGALFFETGAMQNGAPDGFALIDNTGGVRQFLSYEGVFEATDGAAAGLFSTDIGLFESGDTAVGFSLQLIGTGRSYDDFQWASAAASYGAINNDQTFSAVPLPATLPLLTCALGWLLTRTRRV